MDCLQRKNQVKNRGAGIYEEEAKGQRCENILYEEAGRQPADHQLRPDPEVTALKNLCCLG